MIGGKHMRQAESHAVTAWTELIEALNSTRDAAANKIAVKRVNSSGWPIAGALIVGAGLGWAAAEVVRRRKDQIGHTMETVKHELDERVSRAKATPGSPIDKAKAAVNASS